MEFFQPVTEVFTKEDVIQVWNHKQLGVTRSSIFEQEHEGGGFGEKPEHRHLCVIIGIPDFILLAMGHH